MLPYAAISLELDMEKEEGMGAPHQYEEGGVRNERA
jgi:hypothetical protein